jgi:hypothetical protein
MIRLDKLLYVYYLYYTYVIIADTEREVDIGIILRQKFITQITKPLIACWRVHEGGLIDG